MRLQIPMVKFLFTYIIIFNQTYVARVDILFSSYFLQQLNDYLTSSIYGQGIQRTWLHISNTVGMLSLLDQNHLMGITRKKK